MCRDEALCRKKTVKFWCSLAIMYQMALIYIYNAITKSVTIMHSEQEEFNSDRCNVLSAQAGLFGA